MKKNYALQLKIHEDVYRDVCVVSDYTEALRVMLNSIDVDRKNLLENSYRICEVVVVVSAEDIVGGE